jgi:type IV pilus assembly protein PilZ
VKTSVHRLQADKKERPSERRRAERVDLVVRVDYKTVDELFSEFARNINEGGMFVETELPPEPGSPVALQFRIPGSDEPIAVMGRVVRTSLGDRHEPPGMGIEFENLDAQSRELINQLVRSLRVGTGD